MAGDTDGESSNGSENAMMRADVDRADLSHTGQIMVTTATTSNGMANGSTRLARPAGSDMLVDAKANRGSSAGRIIGKSMEKSANEDGNRKAWSRDVNARADAVLAAAAAAFPKSQSPLLDPSIKSGRGGIHARTATLHRVRFVDWSPSSITSLALSPLTWDPHSSYPFIPSFTANDTGSGTSGREILAIGRQNGIIEIHAWIGGEGRLGQAMLPASLVNNTYQVKHSHSLKRHFRSRQPNRQGWVLIKTLSAPHPSRVEHLLFTHQYSLSPSDLDLLDEGQEQDRELTKLLATRPRLFSAGGGSDLWEWDWQDGGIATVRRSLSSQGGAIWSMAVNPSHTKLALGCDDGAVRIISLLDGELEHIRRFDACKTRLLSIAWGPMQRLSANYKIGPNGKRRMTKAAKVARTAAAAGSASDYIAGDFSLPATEDIDDTEDLPQENKLALQTSWQDSFVVTGCADSSVRIWNAQTGRCDYRMTTDKRRSEHTLVWTITVLRDRTIVSGDSMGNVTFWDSKLGTQLQSFRAHRADILCLTVGPDGKAVYSSGADQRIAQIQYIDVKSSLVGQGYSDIRSRWELTQARRIHAHDVRALALSPHHTLSGPTFPAHVAALQAQSTPLIISGGLDFSPSFTPAATALLSIKFHQNPLADSENLSFQEGFVRRGSYVPQRSSPVCLAKHAKLLVSRSEASLTLWAIHNLPKSQLPLNGKHQEQPAWDKILQMDINTRTNLVTHAVAPDGSWLALSDAFEVKAYKLKYSTSKNTWTVKRNQAVTAAIQRHASLADDYAASQLAFTEDSSRLVIATAAGSRIAIVALPENSEADAEVLRVFEQHRKRQTSSSSGRLLAKSKASKVATNGEVNGHHANSGDSDGSSDDDDNAQNDDKSIDDDAEHISEIAAMATSIDGQWLATVDFARRLHIFNLDSLQYHAALPSLELPATCLNFSPSTPSLLAVGSPNNIVTFFNVETREIPAWAEHLVTSPSGALKALRDPLIGMTFDPSPGMPSRDMLLLHGSSWLAKMSIPADTTSKRQLAAASALNGTSPPRLTASNRKRGIDSQDDVMQIDASEDHLQNGVTDGNSNSEYDSDNESDKDDDDNQAEALKEEQDALSPPSGGRSWRGTHTEVMHKYNSILLVDFLADGELVIVERPYVSMLGQMAPAFVAPKYGT